MIDGTVTIDVGELLEQLAAHMSEDESIHPDHMDDHEEEQQVYRGAELCEVHFACTDQEPGVAVAHAYGTYICEACLHVDFEVIDPNDD